MLKLSKILFTFFAISITAFSQTFNLLTAKPSDKVAKSNYFKIQNHAVAFYDNNSLTQIVSVLTSDTLVVNNTNKATFVSENKTIAASFSLEQNFPNPFNGSTVIRYMLPNEAQVSIRVYDIAGREVQTLVNETKQSGVHSVQFRNEDIASGTYFYRIMTTDNSGYSRVDTKKMIVMK